jgi:alkanesulfonate monooxygenase SsuD/methylene tetrahydromethanopterin reductase-like flavin-dependent oxidoreductase (luciferase family)
MAIKFLANVAMVDPSFYIPLAQAAEEAGYDGVSVPDSIFYPHQASSRYPYNADGTRQFLENKPFIEPLIATAAMGAATSRVLFYSSVLKLPIRHPVIFAKEVTSLAVMVDERFRLGVGSSPWPEDYAAVGLGWEGRGERFDECIEIVRGLCTGDYFSFDGRYYKFGPLKLNPVPSRPVPVLIGGHADANLRRAARIGDGWISAGCSTEQLAAWLERLHALRVEYVREHLPFEVHATTEDSFSATGTQRLEMLGVTHTSGGFGRFNPYGLEADPETLQEKLDNLRRYADEVLKR